jgi:hypothetical protein
MQSKSPKLSAAVDDASTPAPPRQQLATPTPVLTSVAAYPAPSVICNVTEVTDVASAPSTQPPAPAEISYAELAWKELDKPTSWILPTDWENYKVKHGLSCFEELSFLGESEVEELESKLTTIPLKKFKKYMENVN